MINWPMFTGTRVAPGTGYASQTKGALVGGGGPHVAIAEGELSD